jgi:hypothetical protein
MMLAPPSTNAPEVIMRLPMLGVLSLASFASACSDSSGTGDNATIAFNVATQAAGGAPLAMSGAPDTLIDGSNVLVIDTAQLVIRDIKLHLVEDGLCTDDDDDDLEDGNSGSDDDSSGSGDGLRAAHFSDDDDDGNDDCDELRIGPYLLDLPLGAGAARQFTVDVPAGSYREVKFKVHKATRESDRSFIAAHPEFEQRSVRVVGTWNGVPYVFTSDVSASQETEFNPPLDVAEAAGTDLTLFIDIATWFRVNGVLVDPGLANEQQPLASQVKNNIKASIRTFCDDDRDGHDDDDDDDDGGENRGPGGGAED